MKELTLNGKNNSSRIITGRGSLQNPKEHCRDFLTRKNKPSRICVITDTNVEKLYLESLEKRIRGLGIPVFHHVLYAGEENKNLAAVSEIYDTLSNHQTGRDDMIMALGGGVTGDIAGFAAATYLRGIRYFVQIPTTLLAQVDSSVGGKCGVDLPQGKNLVGAFRQPDLVIIDPDVLKTLPKNTFTDGMAEVIKYGCIRDPQILDMIGEMGLNGYDKKDAEITELIERCIRIKTDVVEADETEEGLRRILNFGHTIGHGVEKLGGFTQFSHGEAVSIGMTAAVRLGESLGITQNGCCERLSNILHAYDLPTNITYTVEEIYAAMMSDKKKQGDSIHFVFIEDFGKAQVKAIPVTELLQMMKVLGD